MNLGTRHREITRLEGFSDAVFGFALTLLVVSLEVPTTYAELVETMRGFGAFACCFAIVAWIWYEHNLFFRRYGMQDGLTITLNLLLLFVVLFYVYPLKFVFTTLLSGIFGGRRQSLQIIFTDGPTLMIIYSLALVLLFLVFTLLYWHAYRHRAELELDAFAVFDAKTGMLRHLLTTGIALASVILVLLLPRRVELAGFIYFLLGPAHAALGIFRGSRREKMTPSPAAT